MGILNLSATFPISITSISLTLISKANVLISDYHKAILCDFGLSRFGNEISTGQTSSTAFAGVIRFMAPEILLGKGRKSIESDMYSFACTCVPVSRVT